MSLFKQRVALMNSLCRICGQEGKNHISVFGENGRRHEVEKKIRLCLPLIIEEVDTLPKQICITCLHKLDATWELLQLCKNGQVLIEKRLYAISENNNKEKEVYKNLNLIDEKVSQLTENQPITIGDSVIISLVPVEEPPPPLEAPPPTVMAPATSEGVVGMAPTYQVPSPTTTAAPTMMSSPPPVNNNVYPQGLIQVLPSNKPVLYQERNNVAKSTPIRRNIVTPTKRVPASKSGQVNTQRPNILPRRSLPATSKRASKGRNPPSLPAPKRVLIMCKYCKKSFPDEIIDHHVSLHLRQSFFTCLDCNKNFRSEMAMSRHRCDTTDTSTIDTSTDNSTIDVSIDLDPDDDLICL